jgi:hypothetical protein
MSREERDINADNNGEVHGEGFALPGFKVDKFGNKFALPVADDESLFDSNPLAWPNQEQLAKEGWYTYFETEENMGIALSRGFRPVSREEAGFAHIDGAEETEYGKPEALVMPHRVGNMTLIKAPMETYLAIDKQRQRVARAATHPILYGNKNKRKETKTDQGNVTEEDTINAAMTVARITPASGER